jgi:trimeric autotransporter adhesin
MKHLLLALILFTTCASAQDDNTSQRLPHTLPVEAPAKAAGSLSGQYTIGGISPDYPTFGAAFADLALQGVTGPVEFFVRAGTYNEQVSLGVITGASVSSPVVFHSELMDSTTVTLTFPASATATSNYTLQLNGADYVTFQQMTIERSGTGAFSTAVELTNECDNVVFTNNVFKGPSGQTATNTTGSQSGIFSDDLSSNDNLKVTRNSFQNNSNGLWLNGSGTGAKAIGVDVSDNIFSTFYVGVFLLYHEAPIIHNNTITRNNLTSAIDYYGISLRYVDGGLMVVKNKVSTYTGNYGIRLRECNGTIAEGLVANNFTQVGDANIGRGLSLEDGCISQSILNNTVHYSQSSTSGRAFNVEGTGTSLINILNNCFINHGGGYPAYIAANATSGIVMSNYNCFYTTGIVFGFWGNNLTNLSAWQIASSNKDLNSINANVTFVSAYDLHVNAPALDNAGTPAGLPDDIDGQPRSATTPDIGADEFTFSSVGEVESGKAFIAPNPFKEKAVIRIGNNNSAQQNIYRVMDLQGRCVREDQFTGNSFVFTKGELPAGLYFIDIASSETKERFLNRIIITD